MHSRSVSYKLPTSLPVLWRCDAGRAALELAMSFSAADVNPDGRPPRSAELYAAGRVIGFKCFDENFEFMKCKAKESHPTACEAQGTEVHKCVYDLFKQFEAKAPKQFVAYTQCIDDEDLRVYKCKETQKAFETTFYAAS